MLLSGKILIKNIETKSISKENKILSTTIVKNKYNQQEEDIKVLESKIQEEINVIQSLDIKGKELFKSIQKEVDALKDELNKLKHEKESIKKEIEELNSLLKRLYSLNDKSANYPELEEIRIELKKMIGNNQQESCLESLIARLKTTSIFYNVAIILKSRMLRNEMSHLVGCISKMDFEKMKNIIIFDMVKLIDDISQKDLL